MPGGRKAKPQPRSLEDAFGGDERLVDPPPKRQASKQRTASNANGGRAARGAANARNLDLSRSAPRGLDLPRSVAGQTTQSSRGRGRPSASNGGRVQPTQPKKANNTLAVPGEGAAAGVNSNPQVVVSSEGEASTSYASAAKKAVTPKGICQLRIAILDKEGKIVPIKRDQWPATFTDFQLYLESKLDWAKVASGETSIPTWQAEGHNGQHAYVCPTDAASRDQLIEHWENFKPKVGKTQINFVAVEVAKEEWLCQMRIATWTIPSDPKAALIRAECDVKAVILLNQIPGKWANARLKPSSTGNGTILSWEPDQVMVEHLKTRWISPAKPDIMDIKWKFDGRPHYIHMHDLVLMRQKRTGERRASFSSVTSAQSGDGKNQHESDPLTQNTAQVEDGAQRRQTIDERLASLTSEAKDIKAKDKQGKLITLNQLMTSKPNRYAGFCYYYNVLSKNLQPLRQEKASAFMNKHSKLHDGVFYYFDPMVNKLNLFNASTDPMDTSEKTSDPQAPPSVETPQPLLAPDTPVPPRVGSPRKPNKIYWQWTGDMTQVETNMNALLTFLHGGGFIHEPLAIWLNDYIFTNPRIMEKLNQQCQDLLQKAIRQALSKNKK